MQALEDIFAIWPSLAEMASAIGQKEDTVYRWKRSGRIPPEHWSAVIEKAAKLERLVTVGMLLSLNRPARQRGQPAHKAQRKLAKSSAAGRTAA